MITNLENLPVVKQLTAARTAAEVVKIIQDREAEKATKSYDAVRASGGDSSTQPKKVTTKAAKGAQVSPLAFSDADLGKMYKAFQDRQNCTIKAVETKAFSTVDSLLPAELDPQVVGHMHEWRILDRLPTITVSAPMYEYIVHNFAADSGGPTTVSEGAAKPEYVPAATSSIALIQKIAMHTGISYETLADWPQWLAYVQTECFRQMMDAENSQLLGGNGTSPNLLGFFNVSGILTHNAGTDPSGWTGLDSIEQSIVQMRTGSALAEPNLLILHPACWGALRRTKSTTGQYILADPTSPNVSRLWEVDVLVTTAMTNGSGLLLDTENHPFGRALIREGIVMHQGFSGTDFIDNVVRYVFEERLALAVERPASVLAISNLPTA